MQLIAILDYPNNSIKKRIEICMIPMKITFSNTLEIIEQIGFNYIGCHKQSKENNENMQLSIWWDYKWKSSKNEIKCEYL